MHIKRGNFDLYAAKFTFDLFYQRDCSGRVASFTQRFQLLGNIRHVPRADAATRTPEGVGRLAQKRGIAPIQRVS